MERRNNERRITDRQATQLRREFWQHKQAESDRRESLDRIEAGLAMGESQVETKADSISVSDWQARFQAAKNQDCIAYKNFRGVGLNNAR